MDFKHFVLGPALFSITYLKPQACCVTLLKILLSRSASEEEVTPHGFYPDDTLAADTVLYLQNIAQFLSFVSGQHALIN